MGINREDKDKALEAALLQIHKQFGQGAIMKLGDEGSRLNIDSISTGSVSLDIATGIGVDTLRVRFQGKNSKRGAK